MRQTVAAIKLTFIDLLRSCVYRIAHHNPLWGAYSLPSCSNPVKGEGG